MHPLKNEKVRLDAGVHDELNTVTVAILSV